jgi:ribosomal protein S18 acetylase RimI-like enzyme
MDSLYGSNMVRVEHATIADYDAIWRVMSETWEVTYSRHFTPGQLIEARRVLLDALPLESALVDPGLLFLLAWDKSTLLGFVAARALPSGDLYVLRLYVLPAYHRRGLGTMLMKGVLASYPDAQTIRLDVDAGNQTGLAFWTNHGFRETGRKQARVTGVTISLIEMAKPLG